MRDEVEVGHMVFVHEHHHDGEKHHATRFPAIVTKVHSQSVIDVVLLHGEHGAQVLNSLSRGHHGQLTTSHHGHRYWTTHLE